MAHRVLHEIVLIHLSFFIISDEKFVLIYRLSIAETFDFNNSKNFIVQHLVA
ncbi:MAG: hypothetical protein IPG01_08010 [Chitinophagaceae bacterium]|nr:hypothetical protein [Chitinophagaceae bacterium]